MVRRFLLFFSVLLVATSAVAYEAADVVIAQPGSMPLILTVPHDGGENLGWMPARNKGTSVRDMGTRDLAEQVVSLIERRLGKKPYLVEAKFSRKFLDANRAEQDAMESPGALPAYKAYHGQIASFIAEMKERYGENCLLIDVHGQSDEPNTTFRGTRAGLTAQALVRRAGGAALQGEKSITGVLSAKGYSVFPGVDATSLQEDARFSGGFTVATYGSHKPEGVDAIQLEFAKRHRTNRHLAEDLADALVIFMTEYGYLKK